MATPTTTYTALGLPETITTHATDIQDQTQTIGYDTTFPWLVASVKDANNLTTRQARCTTVCPAQRRRSGKPDTLGPLAPPSVIRRLTDLNPALPALSLGPSLLDNPCLPSLA